MSRFEACLLDYGNTIVEFDTRQITWIVERLGGTLGKQVAPVETEVLQSAMSRVIRLPHVGDPPTLRELEPAELMGLLLDEVYGKGVSQNHELVEECDRQLQEYFIQSIRTDRETVDLLEALGREIPLGLVSNYSCGKSLRRSLERLDIASLLSPVVISGEVGYVKPHEGMFLEALAAIDVEPERVLFVGDRWDYDLLGARNVGMKTCHHIGYTGDLDLEERYVCYRPDYSIDHLRELPEILDLKI